MLKIAPLSREHDRTSFDCGVAELNAFLKATARQHGEKGLSRTFVLTESDTTSGIRVRGTDPFSLQKRYIGQFSSLTRPEA